MRAVFRKFLVNGKPGFVSGEWADLGDAVRWIREAGGQAVIAHPARYPMTRTKLRRLLSAFREAGGEGLEVVSGSHSRDDYFTMAVHCAGFRSVGVGRFGLPWPRASLDRTWASPGAAGRM